MKNIMLILFLPVIFFCAGKALAQNMSMNRMIKGDSKQIYLKMMDTMMVNMDHHPSFLSPDNDFLQQMIPHHKGAIEMAKYEIEHGKNFEMIQLAKSILAEQNIEIEQMTLWLHDLTVKIPLQAGYTNEMDKTMKDMMEQMPDNGKLTDIDRSFAAVMIPHHQAGIDMAKVLLKYAFDKQVITFANNLISSEEVEIEQMNKFLK